MAVVSTRPSPPQSLDYRSNLPFMSGEHDVTLGHLQDTDDKPKYKGRVVIIAALNSSPEKRGTLEEIYSAVKAKFPWYAAEKNAKVVV